MQKFNKSSIFTFKSLREPLGFYFPIIKSSKKSTLKRCKKSTRIRKIKLHQNHLKTLIKETEEKMKEEDLHYMNLIGKHLLKQRILVDEINQKEGEIQNERLMADLLNLEIEMLKERFEGERGEIVEINGTVVRFWKFSEE